MDCVVDHPWFPVSVTLQGSNAQRRILASEPPAPQHDDTKLPAIDCGNTVPLYPWDTGSPVAHIYGQWVMQFCACTSVDRFIASPLVVFDYYGHFRSVMFSLGFVPQQNAMARTAWQSATLFGSRVGYTACIDSANEVLQQPRPFLWFAPALN